MSTKFHRPYVFAYFENVGWGAKTSEIATWRTSWDHRGFEPVITSRADAARHPRHAEFVEKLRHLPTINIKAYEDACYLRWLAFDQLIRERDLSWALASDTDVFNYSLTPVTMLRFRRDFALSPVLVHDRGCVPCLVSANRDGSAKLIDIVFAADQGDPRFREPDGRVHMSDMRVFQEWSVDNCGELHAPAIHHCYQFGDEHPGNPTNWRTSDCVHFSAGAVGQYAPEVRGDKAAAANNYRKII